MVVLQAARAAPRIAQCRVSLRTGAARLPGSPRTAPAWSDGTACLLFEPVEFLEKLAALTPRPEINLVLEKIRREAGAPRATVTAQAPRVKG